MVNRGQIMFNILFLASKQQKLQKGDLENNAFGCFTHSSKNATVYICAFDSLGKMKERFCVKQ